MENTESNAAKVQEGLLCLVKELDIKARAVSSALERLPKLSYPIIAVLDDGGYAVLIRADEQKVLFYSPKQSKPSLITKS